MRRIEPLLTGLPSGGPCRPRQRRSPPPRRFAARPVWSGSRPAAPRIKCVLPLSAPGPSAKSARMSNLPGADRFCTASGWRWPFPRSGHKRRWSPAPIYGAGNICLKAVPSAWKSCPGTSSCFGRRSPRSRGA